MTDYTKDILTRLQAGEDVETIAAELTKSLNTAKEQSDEIDRKRKAEAEAKRKAEFETNKKVEAVDGLIDALIDVCDAWGLDDSLIDSIDEIDAKEFVDTFDKMIPFLQQYIELQEAMGEALSKTPEENQVIKTTAEDPIERFLNTFVR